MERDSITKGAAEEDDAQTSRRGPFWVTTCSLTVLGYFLLFPPACYWIQDAGAAPDDSIRMQLLTALGAPCRFLGVHCQPYQDYIGWCYELSDF